MAQDEQQFAAEQAAAKARAEAQAKIQNDINHERQKIAEKKVIILLYSFLYLTFG